MEIVIIEDEERASRRLERLIKEIAPDCYIAAILDSVETSVNWFENNRRPDLIFMDINLCDGTAFDILSTTTIREPIVFTTACEHFALKAFESNALDYILKPIKKEKIQKAIAKYLALARDNTPEDNKNLIETVKNKLSEPSPKRFLLRTGNRIRLVYHNDLAYCFCEKKMVYLVTFKGQQFPLDTSLDKLEKELNPQQFFRLNRKFLINLKAINELYTYSKARIKVDLMPKPDQDVIVSFERSALFRKWLEGQFI